MKVCALFSGGKDSVYATHYAQQQGYEVVCLLSVVSKNPESYMFHTINIDRCPEQARAMGLKLYELETEGVKEREVGDLMVMLEALKEMEGIEGVVSGALASDYQKTRIERICYELGLASITPLWHVNPETYINIVMDSGFDVRIAGVFADGLDKNWIGKRIDLNTLEKLKKLSTKNKLNIAGEGGEYETFVVDGPNFKEPVGVR
jgi:ABC transporter with metal-binding/Fe-S-binding domain ATP-binding protein